MVYICPKTPVSIHTEERGLGAVIEAADSRIAERRECRQGCGYVSLTVEVRCCFLNLLRSNTSKA